MQSICSSLPFQCGRGCHCELLFAKISFSTNGKLRRRLLIKFYFGSKTYPFCLAKTFCFYYFRKKFIPCRHISCVVSYTFNGKQIVLNPRQTIKKKNEVSLKIQLSEEPTVERCHCQSVSLSPRSWRGRCIHERI